MKTSTLITNKTLIATEDVDLLFKPSTFYEKWINFIVDNNIKIEHIKFLYNSPLYFLNTYIIEHETMIHIKEDHISIDIEINKYNQEEQTETEETIKLDGLLIIGTLGHEFYSNKVFSNEHIIHIKTESKFDERYRILFIPEYSYFEFKNWTSSFMNYYGNEVKKFFFSIDEIYPTE